MTPPSAYGRMLLRWIATLILIAVGVIVVGSLFAWIDARAEVVIPSGAVKYRNDLTRNARLAWGLEAPIADFAAQIHQESTWKGEARSGVGAIGMAQFMPSTATWIAGVYPDLQPPAPTNPAWAMRALTQYDRHLYERIVPAADACERMAFALSQYNGGTTAGDVQACRSGQVECVALIEIPAEAATWSQRFKHALFGTPLPEPIKVKQTTTCACDPARWFDNVEKFNGRRRSDANFRENRGYPVRILKTLSPAYVKANWGTASCSA